jgi:uncharacterized protein YjlB
VRLEIWHAPLGETIPNHPRFPVVIYRGVEVADVRETFARNGWGGSWVNGVFAFHHFHSTSHEALAVLAGRATLELGGPQGDRFEVEQGDVLLLPAGTGHRRADADRDFTVLGAYPRGQEDYDILRADEPGARERIALLGVPRDPLGADGTAAWS